MHKNVAGHTESSAAARASVASAVGRPALLAIRESVTQVGSLNEKDGKRIAIGRRHFHAASEVVKARSPERRGPGWMIA